MFVSDLISESLVIRRKTSRAILWLTVLFIGICLPFLSRSAHSGNALSVGTNRGAAGRVLSLEARIRYQRAIDEVYWRHIQWPKVNERPAPKLDEIVPLSETRAKAEDTLRKSNALERLWGKQISADLLQYETERIARETRKPEVLRELWAVLENDPFLIAEILARPLVADRSIRESFAFDKEIHRKLYEHSIEQVKLHHSFAELRKMDGHYAKFEAIKAGRTTKAGPSKPRNAHSAYSTQTSELSVSDWDAEIKHLHEMFDGPALTNGENRLPLKRLSRLQEDREKFYVVAIVENTSQRIRTAAVEWRKPSFDEWWKTARQQFTETISQPMGNYELPEISQAASCADDTWIGMEVLPDATGTAVWTGVEMIIWGGNHFKRGAAFYNTGSRYNPATDSWTPTSTSGAPLPRRTHTAVWTGTEMIVWGGCDGATQFCSRGNGGRYNPSTDTWRPVSDINEPSWRQAHTAVWTGSRMIIWGGCHDGYTLCSALSTGGIYDPANDSWTSVSNVNAPSARDAHTAIWSGTEMIIWGGGGYLKTGGRYDPQTNTWIQTNSADAPEARDFHTAVWTGSEMIVWGGQRSAPSGFIVLDTGARYNPSTNSWTPTSLVNAPAPRTTHTAVWSGSLMIVWGGNLHDGTDGTDTGARYDPATDSWTPTNLAGAPTGRKEHVAVWADTEMIVWSQDTIGGYNPTGGRYDPSTDSWRPVNKDDAPIGPLPVNAWTGSEMIVWGKNPGCISGCQSQGFRYDPALDQWRPISVVNAPRTSSSTYYTSVWTGKEMIVWGQSSVSGTVGPPGEGGRYNPLTDTWTPTSMAGAPAARVDHVAVWIGTEMLVWGGMIYNGVDDVVTGGRYDPDTDSWQPMSTTNVPVGRRYATAVWSGEEMIVWGGTSRTTSSFENTGGRYNPSTNSWTATSATNAPTARNYHTAVWTGSEMIVWGGYHINGTLLNTGGRYNPSSDTWSPTATNGAPAARRLHTTVWTGNRMIVWGGIVNITTNSGAIASSTTDTGGRYDPVNDSWTPTTLQNAPSRRNFHIALWADTRMIVWSGHPYGSSTKRGNLYCASAASPKPVPTITWSAPADIIYGTPLSATQLNATANVPGRFSYLPAAGTQLNAGTGQTLTVNFTPADSDTYSSTSKTVQINVLKANQVITLEPISNKKFGDPPFAVNASSTSNLPVTLLVSGPATLNGNVLTITGAGHVLVQANQTGDSNFNAAPEVTREFDVARANATVSLSNTAQTYDGSAKSVTVTTSPSGLNVLVTYRRNGSPIAAPTAAGSYDVTATINDSNYQGETTGTLVIEKASALLTLNGLSQTYDGQSKPVTVSTSPVGLSGVTISYDGFANAPVNAGNYSVNASLTNDNYQAQSVTGTLVVSKAVPIITWQRPADIPFGTRLSEAQLNATANIPGTFKYDPAAGSILPAGMDRPLSVKFTPTDTSNYTEVDATVYITINPPAILLFTEANSEEAIAFEAMMLFRGPFSVTTNLYGYAVPTRIMIFAKGLDFDAGEDFSALTLEASDSQGVTRRLEVEFAGRVPGYDWLTQINFILPQDLPTGEVWLQLKNQDVVSNRALIYIKP